MNQIKRVGALSILAVLMTTATAEARPLPYERSAAKVIAFKAAHPRMVPRPGADGTSALCRSGSKAARWAC